MIMMNLIPNLIQPDRCHSGQICVKNVVDTSLSGKCVRTSFSKNVTNV